MRGVYLIALSSATFVAWAFVNVWAYVFVAAVALRGHDAPSSDIAWPLAGFFLLFFIATYTVFLNFVLKKAFR